MTAAEEMIARWQAAGLLDEATANRLRACEAERARHGGMRWQVMLALALGSILLVAGIALFVAAHWDRVSPGERFTLVVAIVALIHAAGIFARPRFDRLATALHGIGTGAAGIAVFTTGQIFNLQEHWPAGILVWALAAAAGWLLLGDEVQQCWTVLLVPAWIFCEYGDRTQDYAGTELMLLRAGFLLGISYMLAPMRSGRMVVRNTMIGVGMVLTAVGAVVLQVYDNLWQGWALKPAMPAGYHVSGWLLVLGAPVAAAWLLRKRPAVAVLLLAFLAAALALPHMFSLPAKLPDGSSAWYVHAAPWTINYLVIAVLSALLAFTGARERQPYLVNYGIIGFGLTVLWFYFSDVMDKLDRSFSLIVLGLLFVAGGWALERFRRRIVRGLEAKIPDAQEQTS